MRAACLQTLTLLILALALPSAAFGRARDGRPVRNSFVNRPVASVAELLAHVRSDRTVADRYLRHYTMDRKELLRFLGGLHRGRLARVGVYTIYSVPSGGRLKMHVGGIPKGEPMFLDASGRPMLVVRCGNPVTLGPSRRAGNPHAAGPGEEAALREMPLTESRGIEVGSGTPGVALTPGVPEPSLAEETPTLATDLPPTATGAVATLATGSAPSFGSNAALAALATAFLPALGSLDADGGGRHSAQSVPEPAAFAVLAVGALGLSRRRLARQTSDSTHADPLRSS
ncbi:hypothetical protein EON82_24190 [bacterium]|nr:MAG: hypothetical protein EON82_24190 [bacterium]